MNTKNEKYELGRISEVQREAFTILAEGEELPAKLRGNFYYDQEADFPVVGDYVTFARNPYGDSIIQEIQERKSVLKRPDQGGHAYGFVKTMKEQVMIANFNYIFIVVSLNDNYNLNRIARYVSITLQGNGIPVVILTKADLCEDPKPYVEEIRALSDQVKVHVISAVNNIGMQELQQYMQPGSTIALLGSSGVGKSTLVNAIFDKEVMKTGAIRELDAKGRHTTTHRQLLTLANGTTIIDTPGMRELGMCDVEEGIEDTFADIQELTMQCKFSDCKHDTEPGCAIKAALSNGNLTKERWNLYLQLKKESVKSARMKKNKKDVSARMLVKR